MRLVAAVLLAGCFDAGSECADGFTCPAGTRCANPPTGDVHCVALTCGNGVLDDGESCDGNQLGDAQCTDLGYDEGALRCDVNCAYDARECRAYRFTSVHTADERIGAFCAYDAPSGFVAHFAQSSTIVRIEASTSSKVPLPPPKSVYELACVPGQLAVLAGSSLFAYENATWIQAPPFADNREWTALTTERNTKIVALLANTTGGSADVFEHGTTGWSVVANLDNPYDRFDVYTGYGIAALGLGTSMMLRQNATSPWANIPTRTSPSPGVAFVWGVDNDRQFVATLGNVQRPFGPAWVIQASVSPGPIIGHRWEDVFVLGSDARLSHFDGHAWGTSTGRFDDGWIAETGDFYASRGSDLVTANAMWFTTVQSATHVQVTSSALMRLDAFSNRILYDEFTLAAIPNARGFAASTNAAFVVGHDNNHARAQRVILMPFAFGSDNTFATAPPLEAVVAVSDTDAHAVGETGVYLRYRGSGWEMPRTISDVTLRAIARSPSGELVAVGDNGTILTSLDDGVVWSPTDSGTTATLRGVWADATTMIAVGDGGVIVRRDGGTWSAMRSRTTRDLYAVHGASGADVVAVGKDAIARFDGEEWTAIRGPEPGAHYTSVWATAEYLYVGSTGAGYVLRRGR